MRLSLSSLLPHVAAALAAGAVLAVALAIGGTKPAAAPVHISIGPAPEPDGGLPDACSSRVGCLRR
jgi:hypothetical protein